MAQRHGGGGGGGFRGGSIGGGIGGGIRGGYGGGFAGGFRGGYGGYGGYGRYGYGVRGGLGYGYGYGYYGYPWYGLGVGLGWYDPYYYDYGYSPYISTYPSYSNPVYGYNPSPNVTVVYGSPRTAPDPPSTVRPVTRTYDQYGQEVGSSGAQSGSPIYLIATKDQAIRAAASYWVDGRTLHYVTLQHEEKQVPLETVDRDLSLQLNRERHVQFQLPQ